MNKHLNLFQSYTQKGLLPIENNISRGLAIVMQEEPGFTMSFLDLLSTKMKEKQDQLGMKEKKDSLEKLGGEYEVYFQLDTRSTEMDYSKILGVALTAEEISNIDEIEGVAKKDRKYITDLEISYGETLVIIEVKRTTEDCSAQLAAQMTSVTDLRKDVESLGSVSITWTDIVDLLNKYDSMRRLNPGRIVRDYRNFLLNNYPKWNVVDPLHKLPEQISEQTILRIKQRLEQIKLEYIREKNKEGTKPEISLNNRGNVTIVGCGYVNEFRLNVMDDGSISFSVWYADSVAQGWELYNKKKNMEALSRLLELKREDEQLKVYPYVKFAHIMGKGVTWINQNPKEFDFLEWKSFAVELIGKSNRGTDRWNEVLSKMDVKKKWWKEKNYTEMIEQDFENRSYAYVICGIELMYVIKFAKARKLDAENKMTEWIDELVKLVSFK